MLTIDLKGKTAIVTGVSSGVGQGIAKVLAKAGCNVAGIGRSTSNSRGASVFYDNMQNENANHFYLGMDITIPENQEKLVDKTIEEFGSIDILVSNAGINVFEGAEGCSIDQWEFNMDLNLKSHWELSKLCKPHLEKNNNGVIILMTSTHSEYTIPGCFPYNVTKTAIKGLVQSLAIEWSPKIRTIGIAPGFIDTDGNQKWFDKFDDPEEERARTIEMHPVKRIGTAEEVGHLCAFLASENAGFISGTTYIMDGGRSALMQ